MKRAALCAGLFVALLGQRASAGEGELVERPLGSTDAPYGHLEYLPVGYATSGHKHAVLVFLHGIGEIGDGSAVLEPLTRNGPGKMIADGSTYFADHEMMVFIPQSTEWWNTDHIHELLRYIATNFRVDPRQVYLTGLSMGGGGTWAYLSGHQGRVTSAVPICGAQGPGDGTPFVGLPVWAFHAWSDGTVPSTNSIGWANSIADATAMVDVPDVLTNYPHQNGDPAMPAVDDETAIFDGNEYVWSSGVDTTGTSILRLTLYPDGAHDSWTRTYDRPEVWDWFTGQLKAPALDDDRFIVDNLDAGFATTADTWERSEATPGFYWWDYHQAPLADGVSASFTTDLPPALYEVYVSWTAGEDRASAIEATIDGATEAPASALLDMTQGGGFTSLGLYTFEAGSGSVTLQGAAGASGVLVADAVGFVHRADLPSGDSSGGESSSSEGGGDTSPSETTSAADEGPIDPGTSSESTGTPSEQGDDAGCGCTSDPRPQPAWLLALLPLLRRRRATIHAPWPRTSSSRRSS
jgi:dienelactone hydrolase